MRATIKNARPEGRAKPYLFCRGKHFAVGRFWRRAGRYAAGVLPSVGMFTAVVPTSERM